MNFSGRLALWYRFNYYDPLDVICARREGNLFRNVHTSTNTAIMCTIIHHVVLVV